MIENIKRGAKAVKAVLKDSNAKKRAQELVKQPVVEEIGSKHGDFVVLQSECAILGRPEAEYGCRYIGSIGATTCVILLAFCEANGRCGAAHVPGQESPIISDLSNWVDQIGGGNKVDVWVIGAFDSSSSSKEALDGAISGLSGAETLVHVVGCLVGGVNQKGSMPVCTAAGIEVGTGKVCMWADNVSDGTLGPMIPLRSMRCFHPEHVDIGIALISPDPSIEEVAKEEDDKGSEPLAAASGGGGIVPRPAELVIRRFPCAPSDDPLFARFAAAPDGELRRMLSTSPDAEPKYFENSLRSTLVLLSRGGTPEKLLPEAGKSYLLLRQEDGSFAWKPKPKE